MKTMKSITLYHLMIDNRKMIGLQFPADKLIQGLVKGLPNVLWSKTYNMDYIENSKRNLELIYATFKGLVWINYNRFKTNKQVRINEENVDVDWFRNRDLPIDYRLCPEEYLLKLGVSTFIRT